jgi:hypothetical protein
LRDRPYQPIDGLTSSCPYTEAKDYPAGLGVTCSQDVKPSEIVHLQDKDYRYKSEATHIPRHAGYTAIRFAEN